MEENADVYDQKVCGMMVSEAEAHPQISYAGGPGAQCSVSCYGGGESGFNMMHDKFCKKPHDDGWITACVTGSLYIWKGAISAERDLTGFRATDAPIQMICMFEQADAEVHTAFITTASRSWIDLSATTTTKSPDFPPTEKIK